MLNYLCDCDRVELEVSATVCLNVLLVRRIGNGCLACQSTLYAHIAKTLFNVQENKRTNPNRVLRISLIRFCVG